MSIQPCMGKQTRTLNRADRLAAGLREFERGGLGAVKILPLSKEIGASRGSFYWRFRDRADLTRSMLGYWETEYTDVVIERAGSLSGDPRKRF